MAAVAAKIVALAEGAEGEAANVVPLRGGR